MGADDSTPSAGAPSQPPRSLLAASSRTPGGVLAPLAPPDDADEPALARWCPRGAGVKFAFFSTRPSIDALGYPTWGYDATHKKAGWDVKDDYPEADVGWSTPQLYVPTGHPLSKGVPSPWDQLKDPFHTRGEESLVTPTQLEVGDRMPKADDVEERARLAQRHGVEGSWGDRMSFLRAHSLVPDTYRHTVVAARGDTQSVSANGVI